jgi:hypothetical protein
MFYLLYPEQEGERKRERETEKEKIMSWEKGKFSIDKLLNRGFFLLSFPSFDISEFN